jgi:hypothetical protein
MAHNHAAGVRLAATFLPVEARTTEKALKQVTQRKVEKNFLQVFSVSSVFSLPFDRPAIR